MRRNKPTNLRTVLSMAAVLVTLLTTTAALSLVLVTSVLQRTTADIAASVESVRTIEEAEVALLLHTRSLDRAEQQDLARQTESMLDETGRYARTTRERNALKSAREDVAQYFDLSGRPDVDSTDLKAAEARAIDALDKLGDLDVEQKRIAHERTRHWNQVANIAGIVLGVSIVAITTALVFWLRRRVIRPLFSLADTMKRFGDGERALRAPELGPTELREMQQRFNDMADSIALQRQQQTAFLGGVAHDLRNPLSALKLAVDLVGPNQPLPPEPILRRTLGIISRQISHLDTMVGDFLDMAKIEAGELELTLGTYDLRTVVEDSIELFVPSTPRERFELTLPEQPIEIRCDAVRIGQAVTNLVSNAIKYSPPEASIEVEVSNHDVDVVITVRDHGVGIPRAELARLFEPFRRGTTRNTIPGTGLGLYNVQRIVQAHHGRIEVESVPAVGSTFRIHLASS